MSAPSDINLTIAFRGDALDAEERDRAVLRLMAELKELDGVSAVRGVAEPVPELNAAIEAAQRLISQSSPVESGQAE